MFRKLQLEETTTERQYEERLRTFYNSKYGLHNWAVEGEGEQEQDLNDLLNHEDIYSHSLKRKEALRVDFVARTTEHHASVVTGLDWKGQVVASCGYDQKVKLWSLKADEANP
jgi:LPS O-antigen subunit length determinant protein (WzzB/FepE family)